jgi:hypothetical protein
MEGSGPARSAKELAWLAGVGLAIVAVLLAPIVRHGYRFALGPDVPVYLWWTRVGASQGLSVVGQRPGSPALIAALAGVMHLPISAVTAALEAALGCAVAVATAMLVRAAAAMGGERRGARAAWILAGILTGLFTVHLAGGYLANLAFAAPFVGATVCLALATRRSASAGALLLGGGGLAHPQFFLVGAIVLVAVALWSLLRGERRSGDAVNVALATVGGGAVVGAGLLSMAIGAPPLVVDTSRDGFLRRAGMSDTVSQAYLDRFRFRWARYVQWLALPLAVLGSMRTSGFARRVLVAWTALVVIGAPVGLLSGWYPADRLITFGFSVPALAGVGLVAVWLWLDRRAWLATVVAAALFSLMAAGALIAWNRQLPYITRAEVDQVTEAARIAQAAAPDSPMVFIVDDHDGTASFLATRAANVIRAAVPPDRAADVYVYVGIASNLFAHEPTLRGPDEYDALSRLYLSDIPEGPTTVFLLSSFDQGSVVADDPHLYPWGGGVSSSVPPRDIGTELAPPREPLRASSAVQIVLTTFAILGLCGAIGFGWARWAGLDLVAATAIAPAFGVAALTLSGVALERLGLPLSGSGGPSVVTLLGAAPGYALLVAQRPAVAPPVPSVEQEPHE